MVEEVTVLKDLQGALEQQRVSLEALHRRQSELSEENAALRECLESLGILCGQAFLSRLHRRRLERVLSRHPMSQTQATLEAVLRTSELAVNVANYSGPSFCQSIPAARGIAVSTPELDRLFPASIYVVGGAGSVSNRPLRTLECFSPATKQCETRAPMDTGQSRAMGNISGSADHVVTDPTRQNYSLEESLNAAADAIAAAGLRQN
eukprot:s1809_g12.t1